jgi:hypothetical protein
MPQNKYWPPFSATAAKRYGVPMRSANENTSAHVFICLFYLRALDSERHAAGVYESKGKGKFLLPEINGKTRWCVQRLEKDTKYGFSTGGLTCCDGEAARPHSVRLESTCCRCRLGKVFVCALGGWCRG